MSIKAALLRATYRLPRRLGVPVALPETLPAAQPAALIRTVRAAVAATLAHEGLCRRVSVSVQLCDNPTIAELNRRYRGKDLPTDVLSFPLWEREELPRRGLLELGDIVISAPQAAEQAAAFGQSFLREVAFLVVHATLHLLGYDHERSEADEEDMFGRQRSILNSMRMKP
ncbi:MAG: rRNA maturation RNase YbeY [Eubacteriales bacterium]